MTSFTKIAAIFSFISLFHYGNSLNILALMGCASRSHQLWNEVIFDKLASRGHTLTIVSSDVNDAPNDNLTYIHLEETYKVITEYYKNAGANFDFIWSPLSNMRMLYDYQMVTCKGIIQSKGFQETLKLDEEFDLILYDITGGPCLLKLIQKYPDIPVVSVSAFKVTPELLDIVGGHFYPAYIPMIANKLYAPMNLWQRLYNMVTYVGGYYYRKYVSDSIIDKMVAKYIPDDKLSLDALYQRIELVLVNTHPATDYAQSLPPSIIEIGGLHIKEPKPLPLDIKEFIEGAERGAVLISLGTNIKAEILGENGLNIFVNVIKKFPKYNFLWKIEQKGLLKTVPKNLLIRDWFPQNDILAHPNLKAFFTHAGGLSIQETTWHGVPVVAMPFLLDQFGNAHHVQLKGCGRVVDFRKLTEASLFQGLSGVLTDDTYRTNMQKVQKQFRDRQNKPLDTAIWWIEYILRNPRVDHLITSSRNMSYFKTHSLDIIFIGIGFCIVFLVNLWIVLRNIRRTLSKSNDKSPKKVKSISKKKVKKN